MNTFGMVVNVNERNGREKADPRAFAFRNA